MPPEPLPWDRKDFFKERKHERSEFLGPVPRWRDSSNHGSREFSRWGSGEFRRPPGHGRQGGWHMFSNEYGHGYGPSMSFNNKMLENRASVSHGDGKYARNGRESRSISQRDWKGHSWSTSNGSTDNVGRLQHDLNYDQRLVHDMLTYPSHTQSDFPNSRDKVKGQHDKVNDVNGLGTNQRRDRDYSASLGWKPLKWTRSGGLSSRTSTSGHSSNSKGIGAFDSNETKSKAVLKNASQNLSPSADPSECAMSSLPCDDATSRKKPRLGWGEGLAKYEKKKVDVPDGTAFMNVNTESTHSLNSSLIEKGPRGSGFSDCTSPATPSSVICGSSPGEDEKSSEKATSDNDVNNFVSPGSGFQNRYEGTSSNLEKLDSFPIADLSSPLVQLLQHNDSTSVDSSSVSSTALSKLLTYKNEISIVLEMTESEIDFLENELKGLRSESKDCFSFPFASNSLLVVDKYFEEKNDLTDRILPAATLPVVTSMNSCSKPMAHSSKDLEDVNGDVEEMDWSGRLDTKESVITKEKLTISGCSLDDNDVASVDNNMLLKSESATVEPISCEMYEHANEVGDNVFNLILESNKESARKASEALNKLLPANKHKIDLLSTNDADTQNQCLMKERFAKRKRLSRFKERVIALKFRAYQSLWKESLLVPPVRKLRAKSQKKYQMSLWTNYNSGQQKNRSSIQFRMPSPAGNLNPISNAEILKHVSKQLSNPEIKQYRKTLKMPALILDQKDKMASRFISNNGLVEDPCAIEKERALINPWTSEEREIFMEKLECIGKDFGKIASFLDRKTTADCIKFYYKNHKSDCFEKTKKLEFGKKVKSSTSNYLMTTGKKWNPETNAAALDILGAASAVVARAHEYSSIRSGGQTAYHTTELDDDNLSEKSFHIFGNEREKAAADVLAGICGSLSSEAMGSSCVTSNLNRRDSSQDSKCRKGGTTVLRRCMTANVPRYVDDEVCSDESCGEMDPYWTDGEKSLLIEAVSVYGKNFTMISTHVGSKSTNQCKVFFSKARKCLGLDSIFSAKKTSNGIDCNDNKCDSEAGVDTKDSFPCEGVGCPMVDNLPKTVMTINGGESESMNLQSTHQEVEESNPFSKTCRSNSAVDADDACNRKGSSQSAFDDDCRSVDSAINNNGSVHNPQHAVASSEIAKEHSISALVVNGIDAETKDAEITRVNANTGNDQGEKARSPTANSSSAPLCSNNTSLSRDKLGHHHVRVQSRSFSDSERSSRNGNVKLFGQILTHSSLSVPSSKSGSSENENRTQHKFKRRLKVSSHENLNAAKFNHKHSPEDDAPSRSYGIWDGARIRTGLSSLPDPTTLLSRFPTFGNFSKSSSLISQQTVCDEQKSNGDSRTSEVN